ncbi:MAG: hypothetical protein ACI909_002658 [Planctomycetota bacterium]|jgi:hypothetical protein
MQNKCIDIKRLLAFVVILNIGTFQYAEEVYAMEQEILIEGQTITYNKSSVKCDIGEIDGVSTRRLLNCDSAELIEVRTADNEARVSKFTITPFDSQISDGVRAELRDMHVAQNGDETWYRFSTLLPKSFPVQSEHRLVLAQWHEKVREGVGSLRPPLSHRLWNGRFVITLWNNHRVAEQGLDGDGQILFEQEAFKLGVFHEFIYKVKWSGDDDGEVIGWKRECATRDVHCNDASPWRSVINYKGSTGYKNEEVKGYYFKFGLYTVREFDVTFTAFQKNYRSAATLGGVRIGDEKLELGY